MAARGLSALNASDSERDHLIIEQRDDPSNRADERFIFLLPVHLLGPGDSQNDVWQLNAEDFRDQAAGLDERKVLAARDLTNGQLPNGYSVFPGESLDRAGRGGFCRSSDDLASSRIAEC